MWDDFNTAVQAIDVADLDRTGLGDLAGEIGRTRAVLDGLEARITVGLRRLGASEASAAETLRRRTGCSTREAKHRARRAEALQKMPNVADALSSGRLTGEHVSALARAAAETSPEAVDRDAGLLEEASSMPADAASSKAKDWVRHRQTNDDLERLHQWQRRNRSLLFTAGEGGMIAGIAKFDRVSGAQFQNLVEALADRLYRADGGRDNPHARTRAQCRHDALLTLVGIEPAIPPPAISTAEGLGLRSESGDSTAGSGPSGLRPVLEVAGRGRASPRLSTPRQEFLPDLASCSLPGSSLGAGRGSRSRFQSRRGSWLSSRFQSRRGSWLSSRFQSRRGSWLSSRFRALIRGTPARVVALFPVPRLGFGDSLALFPVPVSARVVALFPVPVSARVVALFPVPAPVPALAASAAPAGALIRGTPTLATPVAPIHVRFG